MSNLQKGDVNSKWVSSICRALSQIFTWLKGDTNFPFIFMFCWGGWEGKAKPILGLGNHGSTTECETVEHHLKMILSMIVILVLQLCLSPTTFFLASTVLVLSLIFLCSYINSQCILIFIMSFTYISLKIRPRPHAADPKCYSKTTPFLDFSAYTYPQ